MLSALSCSATRQTAKDPSWRRPPKQSDEGGDVLGSVDFFRLECAKRYERILVKFCKLVVPLGVAQEGSDEIFVAIRFLFTTRR